MMKRYIFTSLASLLFLLVSGTSWSQSDQLFYKAAGSPANPKVQASWNKYYTNQGVADLCSRLAKAYPDLVSLETIGKSYQGRNIYLLTVTDRKTKDPLQKPGFWIDGNIHSVELQGTEMALYIAWYLCEMYDENDFIRKLLTERTFYIAPTINPDGREYFTSATIPPRSGLAPRDNDRDGLVDEDGTDDLNGDKEISMMRIKSTRGNMKIDPADPRKMIRVAPDEKGEYEMLGMEGFDNDGDGLVNEDGPGGYDGNRDWGFNWEPNYVQYGADKYPFTFPENQAVRDFVKSHPNIAASQSFHNSGGMILRGPSIRGGGSEAYSRQDDEAIDRIGHTGEKIIPGYKLLTIYKDMYTVWGGELDWMYGNGCFVYSNELWTSYLMFYDTTNTDQYEFDRLLLFDDAFIPWKTANHPQYGEIEIGGFKKTLGRLHPGFLIETDAHRNAAFCIYNAYELPLLEITNITVKSLDGGLKEVSATIENRRMLPTHSASNLKFRIDPPDYVYLDGTNVFSGMIVDDVLQNRTTEQKKNPGRIEVSNIPGHSQVNVRWIVKGGSKFTVRVESIKGGRDTAQSE
jgi:hypothetical protein